MPLISSPALTQTGNGADMYLRERGDSVAFPPNVSAGGFLQFNNNVIIDALSTMSVGPQELTNVGLEINGPTFLNYLTNKAIRPNVALAGSSNSSVTFRGKLSSDTLISVKDFEPPIGNFDFQGQYNLGQTYLIDIGRIRFFWGTTKILNTATPANVELLFNSVPANTFQGVPGQNTTGLFDGICLGFANINNKLGYGVIQHFLYSVRTGTTGNTPGNITILNGGYTPIIDPNPDIQFDFFTVGIGKSV